MADISKITLPDSSEYNIKDAGALRINGTAVAAGKLANAHSITTSAAGWYKFLSITMDTASQRQTMIIAVENRYSQGCGLLRIHTRRNNSGNPLEAIGWIAAGGATVNVRWEYADGTWTLYAYKGADPAGLYFQVLSKTDDSYGEWLSVRVSEPTTATDATKYADLSVERATNDANGDQIDTTYLKKTETALSSYTLFPTKVYPGTLAAGWYKFAVITLPSNGTSGGRAKITFKYGLSNSNYDFIGEIFVYKTNTTTTTATMQIPYSVSGKTTYFRYNIDSSTTVSLYVYKHDAYGYPVFTFISSENELGEYLDPSTYMLESLVAETPPATALKPIYSSINRWIYNVPVSPGTNQQILSYSHNMITSASVLAKIEFANPDYIKSDCSWETTDGANPSNSGTITLTGTCTTATTANLLILNVVEG